MPDCLGCYITKPTSHFAAKDPICRMCRAVLDENRGTPARKKPTLAPVRRWTDAMPWRDQAELLTKTLKAVAERHGLTPDDILGRSQQRICALARRDLYRRLFAALGSSSGVALLIGRDHSTIHNYCAGKLKDVA